jgi:hypothetical protein
VNTFLDNPKAATDDCALDRRDPGKLSFEEHGNLQLTEVFTPAMAERKKCKNMIAKVEHTTDHKFISNSYLRPSHNPI